MRRPLTFLLVLALVVAPVPLTATPAPDPVSVFLYETDRREALQELSLQTGINILVAPEVSGVVTLDLEDVSLETALARILAGSAYQFAPYEDAYLVGHRSSRLFSQIAQTRLFELHYVSPRVLAEDLARFPAEVAYHQERGLVSVSAVPSVLADIEAFVAERDSRDNPYQVSYVLEVLEIAETRATAVGLRSAALELPTPGQAALSLLYAPNVLSLLTSTIVASLQLEAVQEDRRAARASTPEVITTLDQPAVLRVVQEEFVQRPALARNYEQTRGLEITLTPLNIDLETDEVLTQLRLSSPEQAEVNTEVRLNPRGGTLVAVLEQTLDQRTRRTLYGRNGQERRFFAVYASARPLGTVPAERQAAPFGTLSGLDRLFWPEPEREAVREPNQALFAASPHADGLQGRLSAGAWLNERIRVDGELTAGGDETWLWFGAESSVLNSDTRLGARVHFGDAGGRISVGVSDWLEASPHLAISAGLHPIVYNLTEGRLDAPYWWVQAELRQDRFSARLRAANEGSKPTWRAGLGYQVSETIDATVSYEDSFGSGGGRLWIGVRVQF